MAKKVKMNTHIIMLDNGDTIDLIVPSDHEEFYNEFLRLTKTSGFYYIGNWLKVSAAYKGTPLDYINMDRVIGVN